MEASSPVVMETADLSAESLDAKLNRGRGSWPWVTVQCWERPKGPSRTRKWLEYPECQGVSLWAMPTPALSLLGSAGAPSKPWGKHTDSAHWEPFHQEHRTEWGRQQPVAGIIERAKHLGPRPPRLAPAAQEAVRRCLLRF